MKTNKRMSIIIRVLLITWFLQTIGILTIGIGRYNTYQYKDYGSITLGSVLPKKYSIEINWGSDTHMHAGFREKISVDITEFNNWDWKLFIPFYTVYHPVVKGVVKRESGEILGHLAMTDKMEFLGIYGRGAILSIVRESFSDQIIQYMNRCQENNTPAEVAELMCRDEMSFNSALSLKIKGASMSELKGSAPKTYYCLKQKNHWVDTIFFLEYQLGIDSLVGYETMEFDRDLGNITQRRYYNDGQLLMHATYGIAEFSHDLFSKVRKPDDSGASISHGRIRDIEIFKRVSTSHSGSL